MVGRLAAMDGWLISWLVACLVGCLLVWVGVWEVGQSVCLLVCLFAGGLLMLVVWLIGCTRVWLEISFGWLLGHGLLELLIGLFRCTLGRYAGFVLLVGLLIGRLVSWQILVRWMGSKGLIPMRTGV